MGVSPTPPGLTPFPWERAVRSSHTHSHVVPNRISKAQFKFPNKNLFFLSFFFFPKKKKVPGAIFFLGCSFFKFHQMLVPLSPAPGIRAKAGSESRLGNGVVGNYMTEFEGCPSPQLR